MYILAALHILLKFKLLKTFFESPHFDLFMDENIPSKYYYLSFQAKYLYYDVMHILCKI